MQMRSKRFAARPRQGGQENLADFRRATNSTQRNIMKRIASTLLVTLGIVSAAWAQTSSPAAAASSPAAASSSAGNTDLYHIHFAKSATVKAAEHGDMLKKQDPKAAMPGHMIVLRHLTGDA